MNLLLNLPLQLLTPVRAGFEPRFMVISDESVAKPAPTTPDS
ncbi:hypothetical protein [Chroococcidiopsis sp. SAG 2025]|nr:hypothetical protein [Chroococcidiopsis sp. SAG 2025]